MQKIKDFIKNSTIIASIYYYTMYIFYWLLDHTTNKKNKIMFVSFSGRQYSDSPKVIFEEMKNDPRYQDYEFIWAFNHPSSFSYIEGATLLNINTFKYLKELFSCKVWVSNASIEKLIPYKSRKIYYLNTWHGVPLKKIGSEETGVGPLIKKWYEQVEFDLLIACSDYDLEIFKRIFPNTKNIKKYGLPRNKDVKYSDEKINKLKVEFCHKHGIEIDKRLILYAPTFRETTPKDINQILTGNILPKAEDNAYLLIRTHYFEKIEIQHPYIINVSDEDLTGLMNLSDSLITDYSSLMFDYAILDKPIYLYCYDYEFYSDTRGLYVDIVRDKKFPLISDDTLSDIYLTDNSHYQVNVFIREMNLTYSTSIQEILDSIV